MRMAIREKGIKGKVIEPTAHIRLINMLNKPFKKNAYAFD